MGFAFGIFDSLDLGGSTPGAVLADRLELAVAAEAAGVAHYHVTEHHGTPLSVCPSPALFLAALSQRTHTMRMGALVHVLPAYHPLRLAEEVATLDQLCHGRLDLGVGRGVSPYELAYFGINERDTRALFESGLRSLTEALAIGRMRSGGAEVELSVSPVQRPHPPLWYASSNSGTAGWAGERGVNFVGRWNNGAFVDTARTYWDSWPGAGARPRVGIAARVYLADTDRLALDRFRTANEVYKRELTMLWHQHGDHRADPTADTEIGLANGTALVGSPDTVAELLVEKLRRTEINYFEATFAFGDLSKAEALDNLAAFADVVMPAVHEEAGENPRTSQQGGATVDR